MVDQPFLLRSRVIFMFVLLLGSANLASTGTICRKCGNSNVDSPSKKVVDYNVKISESGEGYNETIEVDTEKKTELFKVPAHNDVDHSNILHDFKTNMSMLLLPEKKICYLFALQDDLLTPRKLIDGLDNAERAISKTSKTSIIENKWIAGSEMTDRSVLSDELATFCAKYPIYYVKKLEDSLTATRIQTSERKTQKRREAILQPSLSYVQIKGDALCSGGKGTVTPNDVANCIYGQGKSWKVKCKITTHACYWIRVCSTFDYCYNKHLTNTVFCCEYQCLGTDVSQ